MRGSPAAGRLPRERSPGGQHPQRPGLQPGLRVCPWDVGANHWRRGGPPSPTRGPSWIRGAPSPPPAPPFWVCRRLKLNRAERTWLPSRREASQRRPRTQPGTAGPPGEPVPVPQRSRRAGSSPEGAASWRVAGGAQPPAGGTGGGRHPCGLGQHRQRGSVRGLPLGATARRLPVPGD